jgi:hypothetical protein
MMSGQKPFEPLNLDRIQDDFFRRAIRRHVEEYVAHFGERLVALYVSGSVHRNEAVPGVSDLDLHSFMTDTIREEDHEWWRQAGEAMDREFGVLYGICRPRTITEEILHGLRVPSWKRNTITADPNDGTLRAIPGEEERQAILARAYAILLRYDSTLVWGRDLIEGAPIPPPDLAVAQVRFLSPWELVRFETGRTRGNQTDFDLPEEAPLRLRYLVKLAIYGGASLLMARGEFRSYRGPDVLDPLARAEPGWAPFLEGTRGLYVYPVEDAAARLSVYLARCAEWMDWIGAELGYEVALPGPRA